MFRGLLIAILLSASFALSAAPLDSIGVEKKNGKTYIVHRVEAKETLYALSRKYGVSVDEIKKANDDLKELKVGQTLLIPTKNISPASSGSKKGSRSHRVEPKETMYSIARKYGLTIEELKKANPGVSELKVGQSLSIPGMAKSEKAEEEKNASVRDVPETYKVQPKETFYSISRKFGVSVENIKKYNPGVAELKVGQTLRLAPVIENSDATNIETAEEVQDTETTPATTTSRRPDNPQEKKNYVPVKDPKVISAPDNNVPTFSNLKKDGYTKVNETGLAELYQDNSGFHYALHKTAPVGTIIYAVNEENGQKVYVRVMGKLTDAAPGVILKVSPKAYEKLSKGASKVKINASYIP